MTAKGKATTNYLLSGKLYCGLCGHKLVGEKHTTNGRNYYYYICNEAKRKKTCAKRITPKEVIEGMVIDALNQMAFSEEYVHHLAAAAFATYTEDGKGLVKSVDAEIEDTDRKIGNLVKAITQGIIDPAVQEELTAQRTRRDALLAQKAAIQDAPDTKMPLDELEKYFRHFLNIGALQQDLQKAIIQRYVDKIFVFDLEPDPNDPKSKPFEIKIVLNPNKEDLSSIDLLCGYDGEMSTGTKKRGS